MHKEERADPCEESAIPHCASGIRRARYSIAFLGNYTKDTIVSASGTRVVDGGGFNYGAHAAAATTGQDGSPLWVAAITRLAREDWRIVERLEGLGVDVLARETPLSTCLSLVYPNANPDERMIYVASSAGTFTVDQAAEVEAEAFVLNPSFRGEVGLDVMEALAAREVKIAIDVQGWVRVEREGLLAYQEWPDAPLFLQHVSIVKADAVEAGWLTGTQEIRQAARLMAEMGPDEVVMTHRDGILLYAGGQFYETGFYPASLVGRSGRGDTCLGSYVSKRLSAPPGEAMIWAAALTSLKMEAEGPFRRTAEAVEQLIRERYS